MKIFTDKKVFKTYLWRGMVSECPHCRKEPPKAYDVWNRKEWVDGIYLGDDMPNFKTDSVAMFSVCVICQKKSWLHLRIRDRFYSHDNEDKWPEPIKEAISAERSRRVRIEIERLRVSPCIGCDAIESIDNQYLHFYRNCPAGSGGPIGPKELTAAHDGRSRPQGVPDHQVLGALRCGKARVQTAEAMDQGQSSDAPVAPEIEVRILDAPPV